VTEDEKALIVGQEAGVDTPSEKFVCPGCGEEILLEKPNKPEGVYLTFKIRRKDGETAPRDAWTHERPRCVAGILKLGQPVGKAPETPEPAD
jgi:hypothetical protein